MSPVRYLVAKYVPDLRRMEPRNVGVVVWSRGEVVARFAGERREQPGEVDGRSVPGFVTSLSAYKQWVRFWRKELEKPAVRALPAGEPVSRSSPDFLKTLAATSRGNFHLVEAGMLLDPVAEDELPRVADFLYAGIVEEVQSAEEPRDPSLEEVCERIIEETRLACHPFFRRNYPLTCRVWDQREETFEFTFAFGNGTPEHLYQQLPLPRRRKTLKRNVHDVAWMFEKVIASGAIPSERGGVLVYPSEEQMADGEVERSLQLLGSITRVLNLREADRVRSEFEQLAHRGVGHHPEQAPPLEDED
jgi:hypothetical protein